MSNLNKRQSELYQVIKNHESMDVRSLISMFDVSAATIRKDLALLEQSQLIFRTHGEVHLAAFAFQLGGEFEDVLQVVESYVT